MKLGVFCVLLTVSTVSASGAWDYERSGSKGPSHWATLASFAACGGNAQSPIDIKAAQATYDSTLTAPVLTNFSTSVGTVPFHMNGHSVQVELGNVASKMTVSGAGLTGTYILQQLHFHWGTDGTKGSEHTVDGKAYPLEMHLVTHSNRFADVTASVGDPEGLAVLGFFFEVGQSNTNFDPITNALSSIPNKDNTTNISGFNVAGLLSDSTLSRYYRYSGSLTTPGCNEVVMWRVFSDTIKLSTAQLDAFRNDINLTSHYENNYRPVQNLNGRAVTTSAADLGGSASTTVVSFTMLIASAVLAISNLC